MTHPKIELRITINGDEALGLFADGNILAPGDAERDLVLAALSEAIVLLCGTRPRDDLSADVTVVRSKPAPVLSIVRD